MRVFITGATGTVGREVYRALRSTEVDIRVGARAPDQLPSGTFAGAEVVHLDFHDTTIGPAAFENVDALFFMTPLIEDQVACSKRLLEAARDAGVPHVVRLSSRSAAWDETSALRRWHREVEDAVRAFPGTSTVLRPCSFFQNFITHQAETIRQMSSIILPQGDALIAYVDARDIGDVAASCLRDADEHAGRTYTLTGGRAYGGRGVAAEIGRVLGKPVTYLSIDSEQSREMMTQMQLPPWLVEAALSVFAHAREGGEAAVDPAVAEILGRPATTLSEFVDRNQDAWR